MMVSEAKKRACALLNEWHPDRGFHPVNDGQHPMVVGLTALLERIDHQRRVLLAMAGPGSVTAGEVRDCLTEFALPDPVDPMLQEARELVATAPNVVRTPNQIAAIREGRAGQQQVLLVLRAMKRGLEMAGDA